jgi:exopolysaccharide biosynthesis protein
MAVAAGASAAMPNVLAPAAPFPAVLASSVEREPVAPGIARATYRLVTSAGPLVVSAVTIDPKEPAVHLGTVLARDRIMSKDETVSSMARRTGAVAGINGDYFDINASGAPLGMLVHNGDLVRSPSSRPVMTIADDRSVRFDPHQFAGTVVAGNQSVPIGGINEWPPHDGVGVLTPAFGLPPASGGVTVLALAPYTAAGNGDARFRVVSVALAPPWPAQGFRLAYGAWAQSYGPVPDVGDIVTVTYDTDPPLVGVNSAIGGGPLLLRGGTPIDDPASPNYAERERRIPAAAVARLTDGTLALVVVDGRHPATSIGLNRAELIALLRALGATDAMLFDSGGSATLVARVLGENDASVLNEPSDGVERPVADGLFAYSDAPAGPPARLVVRPARIVTLPGARVALRARVIDANDHALGDAHGSWRVGLSPLVESLGDDDVLHVARATGSAQLHVLKGGVAADVPLEVVEHAARIVIGPARVNPDPHGTVLLSATAFDARDRPLAIDGLVRWSAKDATIDVNGRLVAGERNALVTATVEGTSATLNILVGRHTAPLALFDDAHRAGWKLVTTPPNGPGSVDVANATLNLRYDFTGGERAAYALNQTPLGEPLALSCAVDGDAAGAALRATLVDRYGDRSIVTFARSIDFNGTRRLNVVVPASLAPPIALRNLYVVGTLANPPLNVAGTLAVHDCTATFPGAQIP